MATEYDPGQAMTASNIAPVQSADEQLRAELQERAKHACMNAEQSEQDARQWRQVQVACEAALGTYEQGQQAPKAVHG